MFGIELPESKEKIIVEKIKTHKGNVQSLESAIGALVLSHYYGTRVTRMVHSAATYRKYEEVLGVKYEDLFPKETELTKRSIGVRVADTVNNFWAIVNNKLKLKAKKELIDHSDTARIEQGIKEVENQK